MIKIYFYYQHINENWSNISCDERLTKNYQIIYNKVKNINNKFKTKFNFKKLQSFDNNFDKNTFDLLSHCYLNNYKMVYIY